MLNLSGELKQREGLLIKLHLTQERCHGFLDSAASRAELRFRSDAFEDFFGAIWDLQHRLFCNRLFAKIDIARTRARQEFGHKNSGRFGLASD